MTEDFIQNVQFDLFSVELVIEDTATLSLTEDFIQNVQFDLFSVELVIEDTATLMLAENYVTIREVFVDGVKVEPNESKQIFLASGGDDLWEIGEGNILQPKEGRTFTIKKANEVDSETGSTNKYLNEQGDFTTPIISHSNLTNKNAEQDFQHVTQEEKNSFHTHPNKTLLDAYNPNLFATAEQGEKADSALQTLPPYTVIDEEYPSLKDKVNGIEENANNYQHPFQHSTTILEGVSPIAGNPEKYLNERGNFAKPIHSHIDLTNKNAEASFQHVDTTTTKEALAENDKVVILDSETGKMVLTEKENVRGITSVITDGTTIKGNGTEESKISLNEIGLNESDKFFVNSFEKSQIEELSPIEFSLRDCVNGIILLENPYKLYRIETADDLNITVNSEQVDLTKYIKFFLKINLNDYKILTFPENFYFANLNIPTEMGEYLYEVSTSDSGATWRAILRYKNIATVGIDTEGNEIIGAKIIYVDGEKADNSGNGLTWLTAKKDIQEAINMANTGDAVFVKGKIGGLKYLPTFERVVGQPRTKSFVMRSGVNVYGGFKGIEKTLYEREMVSYLQVMKLPTGTRDMYVDIPKYASILSGEIAGNSELKPILGIGNNFTATSIANNSYNVVVGTTNANLNGFEVIGGNANGTAPYNIGGGVRGGTSTNCAIYNNTANSSGGGVYQGTSTNCAIYNNTANSSGGGGVSSGSSTNCAIYNNTANSSGGGVSGGASTTNCAIYNNSATTTGGGVSSGSYTNCAIYNNTANSSGGGVSGGASTTNCAIYNNSATTGGGVYNATSTNCAIYNNSATTGGGVSNATSTNCAIYNNSATTGGGVSSGTLINCSVVRNRCNTSAGGTNNSILRNTVVYGNQLSSGVKSNVVNTNSSVETYSAFEDEVRAGDGNISLSLNNTGDANSPYFESLSTEVGVVDEIYVSNPRIDNDSFMIDKGLDSLNATGYGAEYDLAGLPRKKDTIDIGAYENQKII